MKVIERLALMGARSDLGEELRPRCYQRIGKAGGSLRQDPATGSYICGRLAQRWFHCPDGERVGYCAQHVALMMRLIRYGYDAFEVAIP